MSSSSGGPDIETLRSLVEESQRDFDKKVATLEEIDDKAMRSVRTAVIILGIVTSAVGLAGPEAYTSLSVAAAIFSFGGAALLFAACVIGVGTYSVTEYPSGIGPDHRKQAMGRGFSETEWLSTLLAEYDQWNAELEAEIAQNARYLELVQVGPVAGITSLLFAAGLTVLSKAYGIPPRIVFAVLLVVVAVGLGARHLLRDAS